MICQKCGKSVDDNATFCPFCGNNIKQQATGGPSPVGGSSPQVILLTSNYVAGYKVEKVIGMVYGITVRSRGIGGNIVAGLRTIAGGEIREYTELAHQARQEALDRLAAHAKEIGANAVLSVMFDSTELVQSMSEIIAFGTAVVISPVTGDQQLVKLS
jgi:uncharacterized protein YbjQ (UPF0145 family)